MPQRYTRNTTQLHAREIDRLWKESRLRSGLPQKLTPEEQIYFVPVVVSVLRSHSRASAVRRRATASRAA
jgi:hypothetical protein